MKIKRRSPLRPRSNRAQITLVIMLAAVLGMLSQFLLFGYLAIAVYTVLAIWQQVDSRATFVLAILGLVVIPVAIVAGNALVAVNYAAYAFLLLVVGALQVFVELVHESREILAQKAAENQRGGHER